MAFDIGCEEPPLPDQEPHSWLRVLWHRLTVRFVLLLGILVFLTAVGIDSLQQALAVDMSAELPNVSELSSLASSDIAAATSNSQVQAVKSTYLNFNDETARRLKHSDLVSSSMTRSRLTHSYLFTNRLP